MRRLIDHTRRNAVAYLALFIALGGTGYAATRLPKNSVGTAQLKNGAVTAAKVKSHSLIGADFKAGQLPAGATGPAGAQGPKGEAGAPGAALGYAHVVVKSAAATIDPSRSLNVVQANVTHPATGVFCFSGLPFTPHNAIASLDAAATVEPLIASVGLPPDEAVLAICGSTVQAVVATLNLNKKSNEDASFYVVFN